MAKKRLVSLPAEAAALSVENAALATLPASLRAPGSLQAAEKRRGETVLLDPYVKDDDDLPRQARDESNARRFENQKHDAGHGLVFPPHQDATSGTEPGGVYRPPPPVRSAGNGDAPLVDCPAPGLIDCCVSSCCLREASSWRAASSPCFADAIACGKKKRSFYARFRYVCPEPVLVPKISVFHKERRKEKHKETVATPHRLCVRMPELLPRLRAAALHAATWLLRQCATPQRVKLLHGCHAGP